MFDSNKPFFSLLLPVYNGESFLFSAIQSILNQSFCDFEVLIGDDGSTDGSLDIISSFRDDRIKVFVNQGNLGLFKNINFLLSNSKGSIIRLFGQDDVFLPDCLKIENKFWNKNRDLGYVYCSKNVLQPNGEIKIYIDNDITPEIVPPWLADQICYLWGGPLPPNISNTSLRRDVLNNLGGFDESYLLAGDWDAYVRIQKKHSVGRIREPLVNVRNHPKQLSRKKGVFLRFWKEQSGILERLRERLPINEKQNFVDWALPRRKRHYFHHFFRCLLDLDLKEVVELWKYGARDNLTFSTFVNWFFTVNGRFFFKEPKYFHNDLKRPMCLSDLLNNLTI